MSLHTGYQTEEKGDTDMGEYRITQKTAATDPDHLANKKYVDIYDGINRNFANTEYLAKKGGTMSGKLNMNFQPLHNVAAPSEDHDAVSKSYFMKHIRSQSILYKYNGITALNKKSFPDYNHGNYKGSGILHSENYTSDTKLYLSDISLDRDTTDYDIKLKFYARLYYYGGTSTDYDISSGGVELKSRPNYNIGFRDEIVRWIGICIETSLGSLTATPENVRFIIIIVEQVRGAVGGHEFVIHCEVKEF